MANPNAQNPTLIPNVSSYISEGNVSIAQSPADVLAANPRVAATNATTVGGTVTPGDTLTLTLTNPIFPGGSVELDTVVGAVTYLANVVQELANTINLDPTCRDSDVVATSEDKVLTINQFGPVGNFTVVTADNGGGSEILTPASAGVMSGGSGPIIPTQNFNSQQGYVSLRLRQGVPVLLADNAVGDLVGQGAPII